MTSILKNNSDDRHGQTMVSAPAKQGLYDPQFEHDACGLGFVVNMKGGKSHQLVADALKILVNLDHRGACGCEPNTGDGAGILIQIPHEFFAAEAARLGFKLPAPGQYGVGQLFLPKDAAERQAVKTALADAITGEGQTVLGWREVPTDNSTLGNTAVAAEPFMEQVFVGRAAAVATDEDFERRRICSRRSRSCMDCISKPNEEESAGELSSESTPLRPRLKSITSGCCATSKVSSASRARTSSSERRFSTSKKS